MYIEALKSLIQSNGPVKCVRVSSAQARGAAKGYAYYGAVRYQIRVNSRGGLSYVAEERASSDRRSVRLAERDATRIAEREDRLDTPNLSIGHLSEREAKMIYGWVVGGRPGALAAFADMGFPG